MQKSLLLSFFISALILVGCSQTQVVGLNGSPLPAPGEKAYCFDPVASDLGAFVDRSALADFGREWKKFGVRGLNDPQPSSPLKKLCFEKLTLAIIGIFASFLARK